MDRLGKDDLTRGLNALRAAVLALLTPEPTTELAPGLTTGPSTGPLTASAFDRRLTGLLLSEVHPLPATAAAGGAPGGGFGDGDLATSSEESEEEQSRLIALVELARTGDKEAFGLLYDHYHLSVHRFLYYRTRSQTLAEDLTSETFFKALRSMNNFRWQGRDFGAWLMTIARNLATDHFKAGRTRLEMTTEDMSAHDDATEGPESEVLASLTNELLLDALQKLPPEQRDCLVMRFLQGLSIAETAEVLGRSDGAVKQLQLRGVRNLAKLMPPGVRD
jgi:RNA polymerase sigma-70 factor (ECF subfamily)